MRAASQRPLRPSRRYELFRTLYSASNHDAAADDNRHSVRNSDVSAVASQRPAVGRLSRDSGECDLPGSKPGNDGKHLCNAAGEAVPADPGPGPGDLE